MLVLDRRCREQEQAGVARPGDPSGGPEGNNDVWLVTNVLDPKRLPAELAARFYRMSGKVNVFSEHINV